MKKIFNIIGFYIVWWGCVLGIIYHYPYIGPILCLFFIFIHIKYIAINNTELKLIIYISILGTFVDSTFIITNLLNYKGGYGENILIAPLWITSMWAGFATSINHSMKWLKGKNLIGFTLGAIFGPLAYITGAKFNVIEFTSNYDFTIVALALAWGLSIPTIYKINDILSDKN